MRAGSSHEMLNDSMVAAVYQIKREMKRISVILLLSSMCCMAFAQNATHPFSTYTVGTIFVHKDMVSFGGDTIRSATLDTSIVWYNFWHTRCKPCVLEMEELNRIALTYKDNPKVRFVAVACDDSASVAEFLKTHPMEFQVVAFEKTAFLSTFSSSHFPTNLLINADRKVIVEKIGGTLKPDQVQDELRPLVIRLEQLLEGK